MPKSTQPYERVKISRKEMMINNFLGGISWGVGTTIGLSVVVAVLGLILKEVSLVPVIGNMVLQVTDFVQQSR